MSVFIFLGYSRLREEVALSLVAFDSDIVEQHFVVQVEYIQPTHEELEHRFDVIEPDYFVQPYRPIIGLQEIRREKREMVFQYYRSICTFATFPILCNMRRQRLRPVLYEEMMCFDKAYPEEKYEHNLAAIGSVANCRWGAPCSPLMYSSNGRRVLSGHWTGRQWTPRYYVFLVTAV